MYIQGKVIQVFDVQTGESQRGTWKKREFILETYAKVPKKVCLVLKGESVDSIQINNGESLRVSIDIESREYKEKWYTEVRAWKTEPAVMNQEESNSSSEDHPF
jgi:hypothetical protein